MNKILVVTTAHDEDYQFDQWCSFYNEFKDEVYEHVIVDNGSKPGYKKKVRDYYTNSTIIELEKDGGVAGGFNAGIKYAMTRDCTHIIFIIQDMYLPKGSLTRMAEIMEEKPEYGVICPVIFYEKRSPIIREYGGEISTKDFVIKKHYVGSKLDASIPAYKEVTFVCGGMYMVKKEFWEKVGLYDEKIFLYGDETDVFYRAVKHGIKIAVTTDVHCWHEHIWKDGAGEKGRRFPSNEALFYTARNYFYLIKKHGTAKNLVYGIGKQLWMLPKFVYRYIFRDYFPDKVGVYIKGLMVGLFKKI
ncbi:MULTISPECIES: glycosyltransferase family 2 protein [Mucilaginibacter]|jgi:GT2 family glycosyltransferase|uniref:Glycosyltransferase family 2 protein n=1 Tax=Mucilaginibacter rubeus TaxID=2027860 RepID=A0AAE6MFZ9_9SPHI|nr:MULTISPECIES: glycosyltransferase family 2 protein [Mucilaginibacter]NVM66440.1 hypothetical protein [Mucilaginibacter sp. SG538B]QEM02045.1 glycosyltransferase family 2 protein [Mucilaginibacter rubeus]QEM14670.1 glycosyltransferase family 2 protein [Mucilaginibacter gossypii]QTE42622.1 glycosyltransferase family 2 protein [Mucilaginibacter rubeus]QTE49223.1 glycosyltransferase family 2 protein [Mucilaginibacter rubeus]